MLHACQFAACIVIETDKKDARCMVRVKDAPICASARQHLVDADDMERVGADTEMERIFARGLRNVLVGANTCGFESLARKLFVLVGD